MTLTLMLTIRSQKMTGGRKIILALLAAGAVVGLGTKFGRPRSAMAAEGGLNACGCRGDSIGSCYCEKKSHCGCPGECEPKGCEERRAKQMDKEVQAETRKAEEAARRQRARQSASDNETSGTQGHRGQDRGGEDRGGEDRGPERAPAAPKVKIVKMTPTQRRDLARLIRLYLAEHPNQGGKAIDQVENEVSRK